MSLVLIIPEQGLAVVASDRDVIQSIFKLRPK